MMREVLGPIELVAVLKLICRLTEHAPYPRLDATLFEVVIKSCLDLAAEERNPVIQVAVLSVSFQHYANTGVKNLLCPSIQPICSSRCY